MKRTFRILLFILPLLCFVAGGSTRADNTVVTTGTKKTAYTKSHTLRSSEGLQAETIRITENHTPGRYPVKYEEAGFTGEPGKLVFAPPALFRISFSPGITFAQQRLPRYLALRRLLI